MKRINKWKAIVLATIVPLLITLQSAVTYACTGSHCGG